MVENSRILVLGGWGLVGSAICRKLMEYSPSHLIVSSLNQNEAVDAVNNLRKEFNRHNPDMFEPRWGNVFTRTEFKSKNWNLVLSDAKNRKKVVSDVFDELNEKILNSSELYTLITNTKPDIVIDCINTATAIAYQDVYNTSRIVANKIESNELDSESVERMMASMYIPQLIRHVQILYRALLDTKTKLYIKIGTSGTGGMGLNIPYTHSEERPSRVLLAKSAVAGAQSLLLFLQARTPNGPIVKEIKPTAAIAWKKIMYGKVIRKGNPVPLVDMPSENAHEVSAKLDFNNFNGVKETGKDLESVFIDTGENGIFSKGEFQAIGSLGQMEIITPEEIADYVVFEANGGNTGKDIIQGLDSFTMGPTYRGGMLFNRAINKLQELERENNVDSIAFEMLGPPRLSKLLYEAHIMKKIAKTMTGILKFEPEDLSSKALELLNSDNKLRSEMLSIGLVILFPDGKRYLRGKDIKIPAKSDKSEITMTPEFVNKWCNEAWIDLRSDNFRNWQKIIKNIINQSDNISADDTSSRYSFTKDYWNNYEIFDEGKLAGWIFENEDHGWRFKR
ncbi:MAG: short-chain dehydrogenase [Bacteroidetes bacterium]|nr:MAG: short-chain dehydrogenase [Bacteroidota bacterium]